MTLTLLTCSNCGDEKPRAIYSATQRNAKKPLCNGCLQEKRKKYAILPTGNKRGEHWRFQKLYAGSY